jgi:hypothetical protein
MERQMTAPATRKDVQETLAKIRKRDAKVAFARGFILFGNATTDAVDWVWSEYVDAIASQYGEVLSKQQSRAYRGAK